MKREKLLLIFAMPVGIRSKLHLPIGKLEPQTEPRFKRVGTTWPLPMPEYSPTAIDDFLNVLTVTNKTHRLLIKCWLIVACIENIPRPILLLNGAPGGAKSGLATAIRETIDPNVLDRMMPNWDDLKNTQNSIGALRNCYAGKPVWVASKGCKVFCAGVAYGRSSCRPHTVSEMTS